MSHFLTPLLGLLSDGRFHSGSAIGDIMGVSRTAVWKHLQKLSELGLSIESVKGKGYRLPNGLQLLNAVDIKSGLNALAEKSLGSVDVFMDVESTNSVAASHCLESPARGYACFAEHQRAGRGRRGRQWQSPFGHNVYMSLVWQFEEGAAQLEGLSLAVGVVVAHVLSRLGLVGVQLKWPNDILLDQRKLGGILLEMSGDPSGVCQVVIGIGLNIRMPENISIDQPWASVAEQLPEISRNALASQLLNELVQMLALFHQAGFSQYRDQWKLLDAYHGQRVTVTSGQRSLVGVVDGVYDNGALCLDVGGEKQSIYGGEVSLRPVHAS